MIELDFYYSKKQDDIQKSRGEKNGTRHIMNLFNGVEWTEYTRAGRAMSSMWDDYVLVGTGTLDQCRYECAEQPADDT